MKRIGTTSLVLLTLVAAGCAARSEAAAPVPTVTVTSTVTATATATVTATPAPAPTVTVTVTETATQTVAAPAAQQLAPATQVPVVADPAPQTVYYKNCAAARAAGAAPVYRGQPGYGPHLDRDNDGIGCE